MRINDRLMQGLLTVYGAAIDESKLSRLRWRICTAIATLNEDLSLSERSAYLQSLSVLLTTLRLECGAQVLDQVIESFRFFLGQGVDAMFSAALASGRVIEILELGVYDKVGRCIHTVPLHNADGVVRLITPCYFVRETVIGELSLIGTDLWTSPAQTVLDRGEGAVKMYVTYKRDAVEIKGVTVKVIDRIVNSFGNIYLYTYKLYTEKVNLA